MWRLIAADFEGSPLKAGDLELRPLPVCDEVPGQTPVHAQNTEYERDGFGTIVTEVTTITTRKRYRVEDA